LRRFPVLSLPKMLVEGGKGILEAGQDVLGGEKSPIEAGGDILEKGLNGFFGGEGDDQE